VVQAQVVQVEFPLLLVAMAVQAEMLEPILVLVVEQEVALYQLLLALVATVAMVLLES
jgi:hypothetical protein